MHSMRITTFYGIYQSYWGNVVSHFLEANGIRSHPGKAVNERRPLSRMQSPIVRSVNSCSRRTRFAVARTFKNILSLVVLVAAERDFSESRGPRDTWRGRTVVLLIWKFRLCVDLLIGWLGIQKLLWGLECMWCIPHLWVDLHQVIG